MIDFIPEPAFARAYVWLAELVLLAYVGYLVVLAGWILLQKREPVATLSWLLGLSLLPVAGFVFYYLFGPQRVKRQRLRRARSRLAVGSSAPERLGDSEDRDLVRLNRATTGLPASTATVATMLIDGAATYDALFDAVAKAEHHIHLEYYIFEPDHTGRALRDALCERARAGVRVRLLVDAVGSAWLGKGFLKPLEDAGASVAWFHKLRFARLRRPSLNMRTHRKLVVIDGKVGFTGGINVCDDQDERVCRDYFHDLHVRVEGEIVRSLQLVFVEDWHYATKVALRDERLWPELPPGDIVTQVVPSGPDSDWEPIHRLHVESIHDAHRRVWLVTPYFVPPAPALMALTSAAQRGLDVRLMVPLRSDSKITDAAARSYFDELLAAGVKVYCYTERMMHIKALLIDDDRTVIGSANFDNRSFRLNFELSVLLIDEGFLRGLEAVLERDIAVSQQVRGDRRLPFHSRLFDAVARLMSPLL